MGNTPTLDLTGPFVIIITTVVITDAAPKRVLNALGGEPWLIILPVAIPCPEGQGWDWIPTKEQIQQTGDNIIEQVLVNTHIFPDFAQTAEGPVEWWELGHVEEQAVANPQDFDEFTFKYSIRLENKEGDEVEDDGPEDAYWAMPVPVAEGYPTCIVITGRVSRIPQMLTVGTTPRSNDSV